MLPVAIGAVLAVAIALISRITNFARDRSYFAVILIVISTYYVLFACIANQGIFAEIIIASIFVIMALAGACRWPMLLGTGIFMHGVFDVVHGNIISNAGIPIWWPMFCASIDMVLGIWVIYLAKTKRILRLKVP